MFVPTWFKNAPPGLALENTWVQKIRDEHDGRVVPNQIDCWAEKYLIELTVFTFLCHRRAAAAVSTAAAATTTAATTAATAATAAIAAALLTAH